MWVQNRNCDAGYSEGSAIVKLTDSQRETVLMALTLNRIVMHAGLAEVPPCPHMWIEMRKAFSGASRSTTELFDMLAKLCGVSESEIVQLVSASVRSGDAATADIARRVDAEHS